MMQRERGRKERERSVIMEQQREGETGKREETNEELSKREKPTPST
jgi:hypothetical protein